MRTIGTLILRFGIIEFFSIFFVAVNILTFTLYVKYRQRTKIRPIVKAILIILTLTWGGIGAFFGYIKNKAMYRGFRFVIAVGVVISLIPMIHITHGLTLDRAVRYEEIEFTSENWPPELNGYRIAFMTDMHTIPHETMRNVAAELNNRNLDLLLLGGDFSMRDAHYLGTLKEIAQISTTDGIFGVEGNHDAYYRLFSAMEELGIAPLDNSGTHVRDGFYLAGVKDMWNRNPNIEAAISGALPDDFILLVSHNPDVLMIQPATGVDLVLSGHTHGGQITFFGFPMYLLRGSITNYGTRFGYGFSCSADEIPVFVSRGIGVYYSIPRVFSRPEVVIFIMYAKG